MLLLAPSALLLLVLFLLPVAYSFYLGLTNLQLIGPHSIHYFFTGYWNVHLLLNDQLFWRSVLLTFVFVVGSGAIGSSLIGLALALCMRRANAMLRAVVGAIVVLGTVLPPATVAVVWSAITSSGGILSLLLGMGKSDLIYTMPMLVVSMANGWSLCGLSMLMFGAALRNVPKDMIEAAMLENAGVVRRFTRIVFPVIRPTVITSCLLMTLLSFGNFTVVFLDDGGRTRRGDEYPAALFLHSGLHLPSPRLRRLAGERHRPARSIPRRRLCHVRQDQQSL